VSDEPSTSYRALSGYGLREQPPESAIHTAARDASENDRASLGAMTRDEQRLFNQGGCDAVWDDRRWRAKEAGDPNWKEIGRNKGETNATRQPWVISEDENRTRTPGHRQPDQSEGPTQGKQRQRTASRDDALPTVRVSTEPGRTASPETAETVGTVKKKGGRPKGRRDTTPRTRRRRTG
jgi:hypothetical protein